ncbi:uncharacterized protein [Diadema antillarum]|uniref:uncharacterized protein n=1 Tax=Diadema antillarum TaxID=105358 RepID=UPI003A8693A3
MDDLSKEGCGFGGGLDSSAGDETDIQTMTTSRNCEESSPPRDQNSNSCDGGAEEMCEIAQGDDSPPADTLDKMNGHSSQHETTPSTVGTITECVAPQVFCYQSKGSSARGGEFSADDRQKATMEENCCCVECGVTFANIDLLLKHVQGHEAYQYTYDDVYHGSEEGESSDIQGGTRPRDMGNISCIECGEAFENVDALLRHVEVHEKNLRQRQNQQMGGVHECPVCHQGFINERLMLEHVKRHNSRGGMVSVTGDLESIGRGIQAVGPRPDYNVHSFARSRMGVSGQPVSNKTAHLCLVCGDVFRELSSLDKHTRTHNSNVQILDHKCGLCGKVFSKLDNLHVHMRLHNQDRPYACSLCGKRFTQSSHLRQHELIHTQVRPFSCRFCSKSFRQSSHLHMHERIHTGLRPYKCHLCDKAFMQSSHLRIHERTHSRVRPYNCRFCNATFIQSAHMRLHEKKHLSNATPSAETETTLGAKMAPDEEQVA